MLLTLCQSPSLQSVICKKRAWGVRLTLMWFRLICTSHILPLVPGGTFTLTVTSARVCTQE